MPPALVSAVKAPPGAARRGQADTGGAGGHAFNAAVLALVIVKPSSDVAATDGDRP